MANKNAQKFTAFGSISMLARAFIRDLISTFIRTEMASSVSVSTHVAEKVVSMNTETLLLLFD